MKTDDEIKAWAEDNGFAFVIPDGYPEAFVGAVPGGMESRAVYDLDKIIRVLMDRDGMSREEAIEYFDFNIEGGSHPDTGPIFIRTPVPG